MPIGDQLDDLLVRSALLEVRQVCDAYFDCLEDRRTQELACDAKFPAERSMAKRISYPRPSLTPHCGAELRGDYEELEKVRKSVGEQMRRCVNESAPVAVAMLQMKVSFLIFSWYKRGRRKKYGAAPNFIYPGGVKGLADLGGTRAYDLAEATFCEPYMQRVPRQKPKTLSECWMTVAKIANTCSALRQCCDPAARCEQIAEYSEAGRTAAGLREEIAIQLAECKEKDAPTPAVNVSAPETEKSTKPSKKKQRIIEKPPFSLCLRYLECQKKSHEIKTECSSIQNEDAWTVESLNVDLPLEGKAKKCRDKLKTDATRLQKKRQEAFAYLDKCVPHANVTREFMIQERICKASVLKKETKPEVLSPQNCRMQLAKKRRECSLLRDCCVQADVYVV
ncbi:unnamed protein product [Caenorhabditis auriculariae]|uniref:Uncharacterized protein n=1 Tax=Caenorhabditis auriculariae TaxID=2777116 RepID=A0A8S1HGQ9_9PELO|nr:unnamed protein product [Caenorhabditis auriculariae]